MLEQHRRVGDWCLPQSILSYEIETIAPQLEDGSFPPWPTHQVVAVGFARAEQQEGQWLFELDARVGDTPDDPTLLRAADKRLGEADVATSVNGREFDALVLRMAAQRTREFGLKSIADYAVIKRYAPEHADLGDRYSSFGRKVGPAAICGQLGIPAKLSDDGGDVGALWAAGEKETIRRYVLDDAVGTLCAYFSLEAHKHGAEGLVPRPLAALARHIESDTDLAHLQPFLDCDLMRWARPRALTADISAALGRVQEKLEREETERAFIRAVPGPRRPR